MTFSLQPNLFIFTVLVLDSIQDTPIIHTAIMADVQGRLSLQNKTNSLNRLLNEHRFALTAVCSLKGKETSFITLSSYVQFITDSFESVQSVYGVCVITTNKNHNTFLCL